MSIKNKLEYEWILLQIKQREDLLKGRDKALGELFKICDNSDQLDLVADLLKRFNYISSSYYGELIAKMAGHIKGLGLLPNELGITAMTIDEKADSSQAVLQDCKVPICIEFGERINDCNLFDRDSLEKLYNRGCRHFIAVDEFSGTGSTIVERQNRFNKMNFRGADIQFCVLTATKDAFDHIKSRNIEIDAINLIEKGISDFYKNNELYQRQAEMTQLESKLADRIRATKLSENSFGFRRSEALYYKELGNIPNNVFPLFWWKQYKDGRKRTTLFTRVQNGY